LLAAEEAGLTIRMLGLLVWYLRVSPLTSVRTAALAATRANVVIGSGASVVVDTTVLEASVMLVVSVAASLVVVMVDMVSAILEVSNIVDVDSE
jgi:hypothetical protein